MGKRSRKYALKRAREVQLAGKTVCTPKGQTPENLKSGVLLEQFKQIQHDFQPVNRFLKSRGWLGEYQQDNLSEKYPKATVALMEAKGLIKEPSKCQPQEDKKKLSGETSRTPFVLRKYQPQNSDN